MTLDSSFPSPADPLYEGLIVPLQDVHKFISLKSDGFVDNERVRGAYGSEGGLRIDQLADTNLPHHLFTTEIESVLKLRERYYIKGLEPLVAELERRKALDRTLYRSNHCGVFE